MTYEDILKSVGNKVKQFRETRFPDESYNKVGRRALTEGRIIKQLEDGEFNFTLKFLQRIADALEVDIGEFFKLDDIKSSALKKNKKNPKLQ